MEILVLAVGGFAAVLVAYANGANDNFKGVATLAGSGTTDYRRALWWATATTFAGSIVAIVLAGQLYQMFSGKGLVSAALAVQGEYQAAVALGAALTVLLATWLGMPISTTHALMGALIGAGLAAGSTVDFGRLTHSFMLPMLFSPVIALLLTVCLHRLFRRVRLKLGIVEETCLCVGREVVEVVPITADRSGAHAVALQRAGEMTLQLGDTVSCQQRYSGSVLGLSAPAVLDLLHFFSAGVLSFARGLNDTAKIAALVPLAMMPSVLGGVAWPAFTLVGVVIAVGGLLSARRVAHTMSHRITPMNHGQGFTANLISSMVVLGASRFGVPVSTTHVSCGSLFGLGAVTGEARGSTIRQILKAWVITLPCAALLGAGTYLLLACVSRL